MPTTDMALISILVAPSYLIAPSTNYTQCLLPIMFGFHIITLSLTVCSIQLSIIS
mgnify:CR=1 FL=1